MLFMVASYRRGYALVIGVGGDLPITVDDACGITQLLRDPDRCAYPGEQVHLLTGEAATRNQVLLAFDRLAQQTSADPESTAVVYFSGHGIEQPDFHLLPFGYDLGDLAGTAIDSRQLSAALTSISAQKLLVVLDCCHAGGQLDVTGGLVTKSPIGGAIVDVLKHGSGRVLLASSRRDEYSFTGKPYSVFTAALLEGLAGYGAFERDGFARVLDLAMYVGRWVPERTSDRQHPIIKVANLSDNFALAYYAAGADAPKALPWLSTAPAPARDDPASISLWRILANRREALLLIDERISDYVEYHTVPLQYIKSKRQTEVQIAELERQLGM